MALIFDSLALDLLIILTAIYVSLYLYFSRHFNFWKKQGVPYVQPTPFIGTLKDLVLQKSNIGEYLKKVYDAHRGKRYVGIFAFDRPALVVRDLELAKTILVKDSHVFLDRVTRIEEDKDPILHNILFLLKGHKWKFMRTKLTPTFTSGKMKAMFYLVNDCGKELVNNLAKRTGMSGSTVQVKDTMARFTTDVIASCAFGIDSNTLKDPDAEFSQVLSKVTAFSFLTSFLTLLSFFSPHLLKVFRLKRFDNSINDFWRKTVWSTVEYREKHGLTRRDFLDNMIELKNKTKGEDDGMNGPTYKVDGDYFVAQAFGFLSAGFETSSSTMTFALYELALHPDIQQRLRMEITQVLTGHNQEVTYDAIKEMKYLDMVVSETLRKYPVLPFLDRNTLIDYQLPAPVDNGSRTVNLPAGTAIYIPLLAIQYDPEYYPEPEKFDPDRFTDENKKSRPQFSYIPFGEGPRICIGMRFGLMQAKTGLIHILSHYEVEPCKDTPASVVFDPKSFLLNLKGTLFLRFNRIKGT